MSHHKINVINNDLVPTLDIQDINAWSIKALNQQEKPCEINITFISTDEMQSLNRTYRHKNKPTNVLSFPMSLPSNTIQDCHFLGDILICPDVIRDEANSYNITQQAHYAHIIIHGILHLLGYDHIYEDDALKMMQLEISLLNEIGHKNPYERYSNG